METSKIRALIAAINNGSLMGASEELGYTSSGLTHMMNSLERELQVSLLNRSPAGVTPTEECIRLLPIFERFVADEERLLAELDLMRQQKKKKLRIGLFSSVSRILVPRIIKEYSNQHPDTVFQLSVGGKDDMFEWLSSDKVDVAICSEVFGPKFTFEPIINDQYFAVLPKNHPKANNETINVEDLEDETFIISSFGTDFDFESELNMRGIRVKTLSMPVDDPAILSMVSCDLGVSILSSLMMEGYDANVAVIPISPREERRLGVALYNTPKPDKYLRDFIALAKELFKDQNG